VTGDGKSVDQLLAGGFRLGPWVVDPEGGTLRTAGREVRLQPKLMELLLYLAGRVPDVVSKQEILRSLWAGAHIAESGLKRNISELRRALDDDAREPRIIRTIPKRGYQVVAPVAPLEQDPPSPGADGASTELNHAMTPLTAAVPRRSQASIAVLAFSDMSPEQDQEYFCDGITEEIINDLARLGGLRVVSRTSSFAFKNSPLGVRQIGDKLGVSTVLEGSVRKDGEQLRITAQLINIADGCNVWSRQWDRTLKDIFRIQEEIAHSIARALEVELSELERRSLGRVSTRDVEAYQYYLRGRQFFYSTKRRSLEYALRMFSQATDQDPGFALAYAGMADCYSYLYRYFGGDPTNLQQADWAGRKALQLDPDLAEAHASRGLAISFARRYDEAEQEFKAAIRLNPRLFEAWYFYARSCFAQGKLDKAARLFEMAGEVKPDDYEAISLQSFAYRAMDRPELAARSQRRALANAEKHIQLNPTDSRAIYLAATAHLELGDAEKGLELLERSLEIDPEDPYVVYGGACFYSRLGRVDEALRYFELAVEAGFAHREWIDNDSDLDTIRDHPRFKATLDKLG